MRKEVLIAIIIGLVMGLFITYGFYHSQQVSEINQITNTQELNNVESDPSPLDTGKLSLFNPENETIQSEKTVKVTGNTTQNSPVVIYVNDTPFITQSDETGNFSKELELRPLANIISVHSIDSTGETSTITRTVVVYDQDLTPKDEESKDDDSNEDQTES